MTDEQNLDVLSYNFWYNSAEVKDTQSEFSTVYPLLKGHIESDAFYVYPSFIYLNGVHWSHSTGVKL